MQVLKQAFQPNFFINTENDFVKEWKKWEICWGLLKSNKQYVNNAKIEGLKVTADIYNIDDNIAYLILKDCEKTIKNQKYHNFYLSNVKIKTGRSVTFKMSNSRRDSQKRRRTCPE